AAQQSAGVDAARARAGDRPRGAAPADETDKEVARTLRQVTGGKKARKRRKPIYRKVWFQAPILAALLLLAGGLLYFTVFRKPSPDSLYQQAKQLVDESQNPEDWEKATDPHDGPLTKYFRYYGGRTDQQAQDMRKWSDKVEKSQRNKKLARLLDSH